MKRIKEKFTGFLFGAEGINKGDCFTYTYESILWGLVIWFATLDKLGVPLIVFFILWAALMAWLWGSYYRAKKLEAKAEAEAAAAEEERS